MSRTSYALNDGTQVPWIAFGTGTALFGRDATGFISMAIQTGVTHLDGAQFYNNEESLGDGIIASGKPRSELYITTKLKNVTEGRNVKEMLEESLKKLKVDHVDLFLIHSPLDHSVKLKQVWSEMEGVQKAGLAKSIGVSNFKVEHLEEILEGADVVPAVNQIEYHPYVFKAAKPIIEFCKSKGILLESYGGQTPIVRAAGGPVDSVVETIRERLEKTRGKPVSTGQVLTKWIQQEGVVVVTTTSKESRLKEYLDTAEVPDLTAEEVTSVEEAGAKLHKRVFMLKVFNDSA